jgi:hypothetical protein
VGSQITSPFLLKKVASSMWILRKALDRQTEFWITQRSPCRIVGESASEKYQRNLVQP